MSYEEQYEVQQRVNSGWVTISAHDTEDDAVEHLGSPRGSGTWRVVRVSTVTLRHVARA